MHAIDEAKARPDESDPLLDPQLGECQPKVLIVDAMAMLQDTRKLYDLNERMMNSYVDDHMVFECY